MRVGIWGVVTMMSFGVGCAHKVALNTSERIPAAEGRLKVDKADHGNTTVKLEVKHLAEPDKLQPGAKTFVVWIQGENVPAQNVGALQPGDDKTAQFETRTPHKDFDVFVTAESSATAMQPSSERLLYATVDR